jgi:hypothetical protein
VATARDVLLLYGQPPTLSRSTHQTTVTRALSRGPEPYQGIYPCGHLLDGLGPFEIITALIATFVGFLGGGHSRWLGQHWSPGCVS